jgi:SAM-dependent methyltransferase
MTLVALRRGKKRAIHLPVRVERLSKGEYALLKLYSRERLGSFTGAELPEGNAYIAIMPRVGKGREYRISALNSRGDKLEVEFSSASEKLKLELDNRGRAAKLSPKLRYSIRVVPWKRFYELFERRSIPAEDSRGRRSEPDELAMRRIAAFESLLNPRTGEVVFDAATGIKSYLQKAKNNNAWLICGNLSTTILRRVKEWLSYGSFLAYDVEHAVPLRNESCDWVIVDALLEYVEDATGALRNAAELLQRGGKLLLLEPIEAEKCGDFYPQDLWELAIWRPIADEKFSRDVLSATLRSEGFERLAQVELEFGYKIYKEERFTQRIAMYKKE